MRGGAEGAPERRGAWGGCEDDGRLSGERGRAGDRAAGRQTRAAMRGRGERTADGTEKEAVAEGGGRKAGEGKIRGTCGDGRKRQQGKRIGRERNRRGTGDSGRNSSFCLCVVPVAHCGPQPCKEPVQEPKGPGGEKERSGGKRREERGGCAGELRKLAARRAEASG